jgi:hypothetical protein
MYELDRVIQLLCCHAQRATYRAVAWLPGVDSNAQNVMKGRQRNPENSWVVSATTNRQRGSVKGFPTGYDNNEMDERLAKSPEPLTTTEDLIQWLKSRYDSC